MPDLSSHRSLMAAVLRDDPSIYTSLIDWRTNNGTGLALCIKSGVDDRTCTGSGLTACEATCYSTFRELFDPVILRLRGTGAAPLTSRHPKDLDLTRLRSAEVDSHAAEILSVRVEFWRNVQGLELLPKCSWEERREVERVFNECCDGVGPGEYYPLPLSTSYSLKPSGTPSDEATALVSKGLLFREPTAIARLASGVAREWPDARGAFLQENREVVIWCNEEEHLHFVATRQGDNLRDAFTHAFGCVASFEAALQQKRGSGYLWDDQYGHLACSPEHLGAGVRCSVVLRLFHLSARSDFQAICDAVRLHAERRSGSAWEVSTSASASIGVSEVDVVNDVLEGCAGLLRFEGLLRDGGDIDRDIYGIMGRR